MAKKTKEKERIELIDVMVERIVSDGGGQSVFLRWVQLFISGQFLVPFMFE